MRLAMKLGVSFAKTTPLPNGHRRTARTTSSARGRLQGWNDFQESHVARRIEKMRAEPAARKSSKNPSSYLRDRQATGVVVMIVPACESPLLLQQRALDLQLSTTASIIQSTFGNALQSPRSCRSLPAMQARVEESRRFRFACTSSPRLRAYLRVGSSWNMSRRRLGMPAFAKCAEMRAPIVPAPRTATYEFGS